MPQPLEKPHLPRKAVRVARAVKVPTQLHLPKAVKAAKPVKRHLLQRELMPLLLLMAVAKAVRAESPPTPMLTSLPKIRKVAAQAVKAVSLLIPRPTLTTPSAAIIIKVPSAL